MKYVAALLVLFALGCSNSQGAQSPARESIRAGVVLMARVVSELDHVCASTAADMYNAPDADASAKSASLKLAQDCADGYALARDGLLAASDALDAYDSSKQGEVGCAVSRGLDGLTKIADAVKSAGVKLPTEAEDALAIGASLAAALGGECLLVPDAGVSGG